MAFATFGAFAAGAFDALVAVAFGALVAGAFAALAVAAFGALDAGAFDALVAGAFGALVARGMVIFPYGKGNSTILTVIRSGLPRGAQIRGRRSYQITANGATIFPRRFRAWCHPLSLVARMARLP